MKNYFVPSRPSSTQISFGLERRLCDILFSLCSRGFSFCRSSAIIKHNNHKMNRVMRKPAFCIYENNDAGNREADQRLCFRYIDSTIPFLPIYEISSLLPSSVAVQPGLCRTWSEIPKTGVLTTRLISPDAFL